MKIFIKPLSVNQAWQGKRFKTDKYIRYEKEILNLLPNVPTENPPFKFEITFGFSNKLSDIDNPLKPILDCIQKKYKINDRDIYELNVKKEIVKKGFDFIDLKIYSI
jgi:Holliday junction resolvase RusA-like endonuclease